ncbi:MAG: dihydroneopterin aldolase [Acidimicrobiales bacterium]
MSDAIEIRGLRVLGTHGVLAEEVTRPQPFEVDLELATPLRAAGSSDDLDATVDYGSVVETVRKLVETSHFQLLESLADTIAEAVLTDSRIDAVTVWVRKLRPPLAADVETVGVRITRGRDDTLRPQR